MTDPDLTQIAQSALGEWAYTTLANAAQSQIQEQVQQNIAQTWYKWKKTPQNHGMECRICNLPFWTDDKVRDLNPGCSHIFHFDCIYRYVQRKDVKCPTCKARIKPKIQKNISGAYYIDPLSQFC